MMTVHVSTFISIAKPRKRHVTHFTAMCSSLWCPEVEPRYFQGIRALNAFSAMEKKKKRKKFQLNCQDTPRTLFLNP